jgi:hypothetical protein
MAPTKRALLIASPYGELLGPDDDVDKMSTVLQDRGFQLARCCGSEATRDGIRAAWQQLVLESSTDDVVVVYYSGHGAEVISDKKTEQREPTQSWRHQFIVPMDYDEKAGDFRGISDIELSHMLRNLTDKTQNVTIILDCCHSGRMARDPYRGKKAVRKSLPTSRHHDITQHIEQLRQEGRLRGDTFIEGNPYAVRVAAASPSESAYEYENEFGERVGALTEALVRAISEADGQDVSWRTTMLRVQELVNVNFPQQHPRAEGPYSRFLFSLDGRDSRALVIRKEDERNGRIQAGRIAGVREKNIYAVMPSGSEHINEQQQIADATVIQVNGFTALAELTWRNGASHIPDEGALAFLKTEALYKWPAATPDSLMALQTRLERSKFLRCCDIGEQTPLIQFRQETNKIILRNNCGVQFASHRFYGKTPSAKAIDDAVRDAEAVARAQHFLTLTCDVPGEKLRHDLEIEVGLVENRSRGMIIDTTSEESITENAQIFIYLRNHDESARIFVSVFDVEVNGEIGLVSAGSVDGIDLPPGRDYTIGDANGVLNGQPVTWPQGVSREKAVVETLVFVISSAPVDLRYLQSSKFPLQADRRGASEYSTLENRLYSLSQGTGRHIGAETRGTQILYDIVQLPILLEPLKS